MLPPSRFGHISSLRRFYVSPVCNFFPETSDIHFPAGGRRMAVAYGTLFFFAYLFINGNEQYYYQF